MQDSIAQKDFFGCRGMHYMAAALTTASSPNEDDCFSKDTFHDWHLNLQERMSDPIAFFSEMMGDMVYLHQALKQPDAAQFA